MATISNPLASNPSPAPAPAPSTTTAGSSTVNEQTFLKLLVTQIKNQNPMNPADGTQFLTQLAQFSQLEQMININSGVQQLVKDAGNSSQSGSNPPSGTPAKP
jgi:flagellar basal-body rod modification protein FlgD